MEIIAGLDETTIDLELEPGEMSLHHVNIVHGSKPNKSNVDRIGFAIRVYFYRGQTNIEKCACHVSQRN